MVRIKEILEKIDHLYWFPAIFGDDSEKEKLKIGEPVKYLDQKDNTITWAKDLSILNQIYKGVVICSKDDYHHEAHNLKEIFYIICVNPRKTFAQVLRLFENDYPNRIHVTSKIWENTIISNTTIEKDVFIGANCTIGGVGFGYEEGELIPHIGRVRICKGVEIGNNVCIDRAVMGETLLQKNVKIDNLVHVAHGAQIGEGSMIIAHAMIGGSVKIGKNVWIAPSASILNGLTIGDNAYIGMGANVLKDVEEGQKIVGNHRIL